MPLPLHCLPFRRATGPVNMATDAALRGLATSTEAPFLRFYGWSLPAATFGYSQPWSQIRAALPDEVELTRRETGGGIVDHREDLTYALAIPPKHALADWSATRFYCRIHEALGKALQAQGISAALAPCPQPSSKENTRLAAACFQRAEPSDVINPANQRKIAGAAMRRQRRVLLVQGSIDRTALPLDWKAEEFQKHFIRELHSFLGGAGDPKLDSWPEEIPDPAVVAQFASTGWNHKR